MFGFGSQRKAATDAAIAAVRPIIGILQHSQGLPAGFWMDAYVLGFLQFTTSHFAKLATHGEISGESLGTVTTDVFTTVSNLNGVEIGRRVVTLTQDDDPDFNRGADDAAIIQFYTRGTLKNEAQNPLVQRATEMAQKIGTTFGTNQRGTVVSCMMTLTFMREVENRFGGDVNPISEVAHHLGKMGYDLTDYGAGIAALEVVSGYNAVEAASHIALTTMALDMKEACGDMVANINILPHRQALLEVLKDYKDRGLMKPAQWSNDARAVFHISTVDSEQREWIEKVLSDPIAGKERLARSRITCAENIGIKLPE